MKTNAIMRHMANILAYGGQFRFSRSKLRRVVRRYGADAYDFAVEARNGRLVNIQEILAAARRHAA